MFEKIFSHSKLESVLKDLEKLEHDIKSTKQTANNTSVKAGYCFHSSFLGKQITGDSIQNLLSNISKEYQDAFLKQADYFRKEIEQRDNYILQIRQGYSKPYFTSATYSTINTLNNQYTETYETDVVDSNNEEDG